MTRAGLVEISFSNPLRVPVDDQGYFNFDEVPPEKAFIRFSKLSQNDYVIKFSYKALEFDENGRWLTF